MTPQEEIAVQNLAHRLRRAADRTTHETYHTPEGRNTQLHVIAAIRAYAEARNCRTTEQPAPRWSVNLDRSQIEHIKRSATAAERLAYACVADGETLEHQETLEYTLHATLRATASLCGIAVDLPTHATPTPEDPDQ